MKKIPLHLYSDTDLTIYILDTCSFWRKFNSTQEEKHSSFSYTSTTEESFAVKKNLYGSLIPNKKNKAIKL